MVLSQTQNLQRTVGRHLGDDGDNLRRTYVERDQQVFSFARLIHRLVSS